jgi:glycerol dehydrogenase
MMENVDDATADDVYRFCVDVVLPVTLAQLGVKNVTGEVLNTIAAVAINTGIHAEPMMVVTRDTTKSAIITADSLGKSYLERKRLV